MKANVFRAVFAIMILGCLLMPAPQPARAADTYLDVNSTGDGSDAVLGNGICATSGGLCTLRAAIEESNATPAIHEIIRFNIPNVGPHIIYVPEDSDFPPVRSASIIGPNLNNLAAIVIDGNGVANSAFSIVSNTGGAVSGLRIQNFDYTAIAVLGAQDITIANNILLNNKNLGGIHIREGNSGYIRIVGNIIGVNPDDDSRQANGKGIYIHIEPLDTVNIMIGGALLEERNIISGSNSHNIYILNARMEYPIRIQGNYIGTDPTGTLPIPNGSGVVGSGIEIINSYGVIVGGSTPGEGNLISGNSGAGVNIDSCAQITIKGNQMSTNASGSASIPNGSHYTSLADVYADNSQLITVEDNVLLEGLIFSTDGDGFGVSESTVFNNKIGITDSGVVRSSFVARRGLYFKGTTDTTASVNGITGFETGIQVDVNSGVTLRQNKIWGNQGLGIDLVSAIAGVTPNDNLDADSGPNGLQNFPVITGITKTNIGGAIYVDVAGTYHSQASTNYRIELFNSVACDANGYGEGQKYIANRNVTTDASGNVNWSVTNLLYYPTLDLIGRCFTATATQVINPTGPVLGNTSEFSGSAYIERVLFLPLIRR